jgi:DNA-binding transcriptional LysR family regulator
MDRFGAMAAFVAVADEGGFAKAARRLRLSPASVTRAVAALEERLGLSLLARTTRSVRLTEAGAVFLDASRRILAEVEDAASRARGVRAAPRGILVASAPLVFGRLHVLPVVTGLLAAHPDLAVRLILDDRPLRLVEDGIDVAVRIGVLADGRLQAVRVGSVRRVLVASPGYLARHGRPKRPADLRGHAIVAFEGIGAADEWRFGRVSVRIAPRLSVNGADAAIAAAIAGLGITRTLSYQVQDAVLAGRLVLVLPEFAPAPVPVSIVHPARRFPSANVAAFVAAARSHFRRHPVVPLP